MLHWVVLLRMSQLCYYYWIIDLCCTVSPLQVLIVARFMSFYPWKMMLVLGAASWLLGGQHLFVWSVLGWWSGLGVCKFQTDYTMALWVLGKRSARATLDSSTIQMIPNVLSSLGWEGCLSSSCVTCSATGASWETSSPVILRSRWQCSYMWSATMRRLGASSSHSVDLLKLSVDTSKRFCMLLENLALKWFCPPQPKSQRAYRTVGGGIPTSRLPTISLIQVYLEVIYVS